MLERKRVDEQTGAEHFTEKRKNQRLDIQVAVNLLYEDGTQYNGKTKNISFNGAFIQFPHASRLKHGAKCILTLVHSSHAKAEMPKFEALTTHVKPDGVGLKFQSILSEGYSDFVELMLKNSPNPEELLKELETNPGIDFTAK